MGRFMRASRFTSGEAGAFVGEISSRSGDPSAPEKVGRFVSNTYRGPVRFTVAPSSKMLNRPTAEPPNVYFGEPDSKLPAVSAQLRRMSASVAVPEILSQSVIPPKVPIWMLSLMFDCCHEPN